MATFHDEANALAAGAGETGLDDGSEKVGLGDGALNDVFVRMQGGWIQEFVGIEGVAAKETGVFFREVGIDGGAQEPGADVVG